MSNVSWTGIGEVNFLVDSWLDKTALIGCVSSLRIKTYVFTIIITRKPLTCWMKYLVELMQGSGTLYSLLVISFHLSIQEF